MRPKVPFNPLEFSEEFDGKPLEEMSLDELELLLYSKRLKIQLELERLEKKLNYSKFIYDLLKEFQIPEKLFAILDQIMSKEKKPHE